MLSLIVFRYPPGTPPHIARIEALPAALAALAEWREVRPVARGGRFLHRIDCRDDNDERAGVGGTLNFALVGIRDARARNGLGVRARAPHPCRMRPVAIVMLHFGPDEVVTGIRHRAVGERVGGAEYRAPGDAAAGLQLRLHWIPELRAGSGVACSGRTSMLPDRSRRYWSRREAACPSRRCLSRPGRPAGTSISLHPDYWRTGRRSPVSARPPALERRRSPFRELRTGQQRKTCVSRRSSLGCHCAAAAHWGPVYGALTLMGVPSLRAECPWVMISSPDLSPDSISIFSASTRPITTGRRSATSPAATTTNG